MGGVYINNGPVGLELNCGLISVFVDDQDLRDRFCELLQRTECEILIVFCINFFFYKPGNEVSVLIVWSFLGFSQDLSHVDLKRKAGGLQFSQFLFTIFYNFFTFFSLYTFKDGC